MINTIEEFVKEHPNADIVNYDIAEIIKEECGMVYRTSTEETELFRKDKGKYIKYPYIQPYTELGDNSRIELFIIKNHKMYELERGEGKTFKIKREVENINPDIYKDFVFINRQRNQRRTSSNRASEDIWRIEG